MTNADPATRRGFLATVRHHLRDDGITEELASDLAAGGLRFGDWLTDDHAWFASRPA